MAPRPELRIIHAEKNGGKGSAIRIGFAKATGTIVAIQDADLELDPAQLAELTQPILDGRTRVVYGSRFLAGRPDAPWLSILANQVLTGATNLLFGGRLTDMETCYKVMTREIAQSLNLESNRFDIEPEITAKLLRAGFEAVRGDLVVIQDADLEYSPEEFPALIELICDGRADVVYGSRFLRGRAHAPFVTFAANRVLTSVTNLLYGGSLTDMETCYKVMKLDVARSLTLTAERFDIEPQITAQLLRRGHRIHEVPVRFAPRSRAQGKKIGWRDGVRALQVLMAERLR